jgi:DNA-directed RNA polymerase subunit RPC12/RpoP
MTDTNSHQEKEITLRCSRCGRPITPAEAIQTPTGYRCTDCVRRQQKVFDTSQPLDYILGFSAAALLGLLGSWLTTFIGFFTLLLAPAAGVGIAEAVRLVTKKRRSKKLFRLVSIGIILGGLPLIVIHLINLLLRLSVGAFNLFSLLPLGYQVLYLVLAVPSAYYRLSGSRRL